MSKSKNKKKLAVIISILILMMIAIIGCNDITAMNESPESNTRSGVKVVNETNENGEVTWLITLDRSQSENGLYYYEKLIDDFVSDHSNGNLVELKELSIFITENIGEYEIVDEYGGTREKLVVVVIETANGKCCVVIRNLN